MAAATEPPAAVRSTGTAARRLARDAALIAAITVAARLVGFGRVITFARTVGPTCVGDVYTTANTIPNIVFDVVAGGALSGLVIPVLAGRLAADDTDGARRVLSALLGWALLLLVPISVAGALLAHPLMSLLVGGGHPGCDRASEVALGGQMLRIFAPQVVLYGLGIIAAGALQARRRFLGPALAPLLSSIAVIATYLGYAATRSSIGLSTNLHLDTAILAGGTTFGVVLLSLPLLPPALRGLAAPPRLRFPPGVGRDVARLAVAGAVVLGSQDITAAIVLRLANVHGSTGAVVAWNLGWTVFLLPWAILAVPIATSAFPELTVAWERGDAAGYADTAATTTRVLAVLGLGATAVLLAVAGPAARILVAGAPGAFPPAELARTLAAFAPGITGFALLTHLGRIRFARGDARTPAVATAIGWLLCIVGDLALVPHVPARWVPAALAGMASIGVTVAALLLLAAVARDIPRAGHRWGRSWAVAAGTWCLGGAVGWAVSYLIGARGAPEALGAAVAATAVTGLVGSGALLALDRETMGWVRRRWRRDS